MTLESLGDIKERLEYWCGLTDDDFVEPDTSKLVGDQNINPGDKINIYFDEENDVEVGHVFVLPYYETCDVFMGGIVHIIQPYGREYEVWIHFSDLFDVDGIVKIEKHG